MSHGAVAISISFGDMKDDKYMKSTHMLSFTEDNFTVEEAEAIQVWAIKLLLRLTHKRTHKEVFGIYKEERPLTATQH